MKIFTGIDIFLFNSSFKSEELFEDDSLDYLVYRVYVYKLIMLIFCFAWTFTSVIVQILERFGFSMNRHRWLMYMVKMCLFKVLINFFNFIFNNDVTKYY